MERCCCIFVGIINTLVIFFQIFAMFLYILPFGSYSLRANVLPRFFEFENSPTISCFPQFSQRNYKNFPIFNIKNCKQIYFSNPSFPYYKSVFLDHSIDEDFITRVYTGIDWENNVIPTYAPTYYIEAVNIYYIKHGFVGNSRLIVSEYNNFFDVTNSSIHLDERRYNDIKKYTTTDGYRYVLTAVTDFGHIFAHMFTDVFGPFLFVNESIWDLKPIVCLQSGIPDVVRWLLDATGHTDIEFRILNKEIIYAENLYVVSGYSKICTSGHYTMPILRNHIFKYYHLEQNKPINYGYMNKKKGHRHFKNLGELINILEQNYNISFIHLKINEPNRAEFARTISTLKIFITPCGSIGFNCILMKEKTGTLSLAANYIDMHHYHFTLCLKIWHVSVIHPNMLHYGSSGNLNMTRCLYSFKVLKIAVENQKWPTNYNLFAPINETLYRSISGDPANFNINPQPVIIALYKSYIQNPDIPK